jgi:hypothetical protein
VEVVGELFSALLDQMGGDALHAGGGRAGPREELVYEEAGKLVAPHQAHRLLIQSVLLCTLQFSVDF